MIRWLHFTPDEVDAAGRHIAMAAFEPRCTIAPDLLCRLSAEARDRLTRALGFTFSMDLFDAGVPTEFGWERMQRGAWRFAIAGALIATNIVIARRDARRLVAAAFREQQPLSENEHLSSLERGTLERIADSIALAFAPLCGGANGVLPHEQSEALPVCRAFVQLRLGAPVFASVGIALSAEPARPIEAGLPLCAIDDVALPCVVEVPVATLAGAAVVALEVGSIVPFDTKVGPRAALKVGGQSLASGECGSLGLGSAFLVRSLTTIGVMT